MALCQLDFWKRVPYDLNPSGYYYWSSVYYADSNDFASYFDMCNWANFHEQFFCTQDVQFVEAVVKSPPGRANIVYRLPWTFPQFGDIPSQGSYTLINVARVWLFSATGRRSWRLHRLPLRPTDWDGSRLTNSGRLQVSASFGTLLTSGKARNSHGELLSSYEVVWPLAMWQLRHGTKRRERNPAA